MKVEIWSDIMCPFCYIGKRKFETALAQFENRDDIQTEWKSFQLMPGLKTQADKNLDQFLAKEKGISAEEAKSMNGQVLQMAKQAGLTYHFNKTVPANTHKAHELIHFAKDQGKQGEAEELLFRSYFTDGKNVDDIPTLIQLGKEIGLEEAALKAALENGTYVNRVNEDINEAHQLNVRGVPFFVFNRKYAISGAQEAGAFLKTLEKSFNEWRKDNPETAFEIINGKVCTPGAQCD